MTNEEARSGLAELLLKLGDVQKEFNKKTYPANFEQRLNEAKDLLTELEQGYLDAEDKDGYIAGLADAIPKAALDKVNSLPKRQQQMQQMQLNLGMVTYVNPVILKGAPELGLPLVDAIVEKWGELFPKMKIKRASYEEILGGFKRRFCYITTAVCESLNKGDDCEELTTLRMFRDTYLEATPEGRELVRSYYDMAPTIVNRINARGDSETVYRNLYQNYINPCLSMIKDGAAEDCEAHYKKMVNALYAEYVLS